MAIFLMQLCICSLKKHFDKIFTGQVNGENFVQHLSVLSLLLIE